MSSSTVLALAESPAIKSMILKRGVKGPLARRFVAGELLSDALVVVKALDQKRILSALDFLGESFLNPEETDRAMEHYREAIKAVATFYPKAYVSVKLSAIGLANDPIQARANLVALLEEAKSRTNVFIRVDMEGSQYTDDTLRIVTELHGAYDNIGAVIQSYLRRSDNDLSDLIDRKISVRLVKGAYSEPPTVAYTSKEDIERAYRRQMFALLEYGTWPSIATHDEKMINAALLYCRQKGLPRDRFEFEMLMGIRQDLQNKLIADRCTVRVYVPYGEAWFAYFSRRVAEGHVSLGFFLANVLGL